MKLPVTDDQRARFQEDWDRAMILHLLLVVMPYEDQVYRVNRRLKIAAVVVVLVALRAWTLL